MEQAFTIIKKGGFNNVDDMKASGGFTLQFSGGKGKKTTHIVGNKTSVKLRDKILEWGAFKEIYPDIANLDDAGTKAMCNTVKLVMDSRICLNAEDTLEVLKIMYNLPDEKLSQMFIRRFNFGSSTIMALKSIYVNWVNHLETCVVNYTKARDAYIDKNNIKVNKNDVDKLHKNWNAIDNYYGINSSSPLLLYSSFPETPYILPWLRGTFTEDDVWDIYPEPFYWTVPGVSATATLEKAIKKFTYLGFCPRRPKYRLKKLFEFPLKELYEATVALGGKPKSKITYENILKMMPNMKKPPVFEVPEIKRLLEPEGNIKEKIKWYVERIINIYDKLKPHFKEVEKYYTDIAKKISEIGFKMEDL